MGGKRHYRFAAGRASDRAVVAQPVAASERNWSLPWGKPLSK
jgi:hypothetical protein